jgi:hypothetical protein
MVSARTRLAQCERPLPIRLDSLSLVSGQRRLAHYKQSSSELRVRRSPEQRHPSVLYWCRDQQTVRGQWKWDIRTIGYSGSKLEAFFLKVTRASKSGTSQDIDTRLIG